MPKRTGPCPRCGGSHFLDCLDLRYEAKVDRTTSPDGCHLWTGYRMRNGYGQFRVGPVRKLAHRVGWELRSGPIPPKMEVCHGCDNPPCQNLDHLFLGTSAANTADMVAKGRSARGERHGHARLTEDQVLAIRGRHASGGISHVSLAREFGVSEATVRHIVHGETWRHL